MPRSQDRAGNSPSDFDCFANDITMAVWNCIAELPAFQHLKPTDYPEVYDALRKTLRPYALTLSSLSNTSRK